MSDVRKTIEALADAAEHIGKRREGLAPDSPEYDECLKVWRSVWSAMVAEYDAYLDELEKNPTMDGLMLAKKLNAELSRGSGIQGGVCHGVKFHQIENLLLMA